MDSNHEELVARYSALELAHHEVLLFLGRVTKVCGEAASVVGYEPTRISLSECFAEGCRVNQQFAAPPRFLWPSDSDGSAPLPSIACPHCGHPGSGSQGPFMIGVHPQIQCVSCHGRFRLRTTTLFDIDKLPPRMAP